MHLTAEEREYKENSDVYVWKKTRRRNDYLDCRSYSVAGAMYVFIKDEHTKDKEEQAKKKEEKARRHRITQKKSGFINSRGRFYG